MVILNKVGHTIVFLNNKKGHRCGGTVTFWEEYTVTQISTFDPLYVLNTDTVL